MKTNKKRIKKELKKTLSLISKLKKSKMKSNQETMINLFNEVNGIKNVIKLMIEQKNIKDSNKNLVEA